MEEQRLTNIEVKLDDHGKTLSEIQQTLNLLAVQNEKISSMQIQLTSLWKKYDELVAPNDGVITKITNFQASCPKETLDKNIKTVESRIKWFWLTFAPISFALIGTTIKLLIK